MGCKIYDKLIAILVPCRSRHEKTLDLLRSLENTTHDKNRIRVITITDFDQPEDAANIGSLINSSEITYELINITRTRDVQLNRNYYNLANLMAESHFSWVLGNDVIVTSDGWDTHLWEGTKDILPNIESDTKNYYIFIDDDTHFSNSGAGSHEKNGSCFPIISNNYSYKTRGPMPEHKNSWGGDIELYWECQRHPESWDFLRLQEQIKVEHYCVHNGREPASDEVNCHVRDNSN
jgi:hypothetical protein